MIKFISSKAARYLCSNEIDTDALELYEYAIYVVLSSIFHITTIVVLGVFFNMIIESVGFYFSFISIRKFAGGYHAKTPTRCYLFSIVSCIVSFYLIIFFENMNGGVIMIIAIQLFCIFLIFMISPLDTDNNPLNQNEKKVYRKKASIISLGVFLLSLFFVVLELKKIEISMGLGIFMAMSVLIMRKIQLMFNGINKGI